LLGYFFSKETLLKPIMTKFLHVFTVKFLSWVIPRLPQQIHDGGGQPY